MVINKKLSTINFTKMSNKKNEYLIIHYVGATGGAEQNCDYYLSTYRGASAQFFVGFAGEVWQSVLEENAAWHIGTTGTYFHPKARNSNSIGIEMCVRNKSGNVSSVTASAGWYFEQATLDATVELAKKLVKQYNIPKENVLRHYDVTQKWCPAPFVNGQLSWENFKERIFKEDTIVTNPGVYKGEETFYRYEKDIPDWGLAAFKKVVEQKGLAGEGEDAGGKIFNISRSMLRMYVSMDKMNII